MGNLRGVWHGEPKGHMAWGLQGGYGMGNRKGVWHRECKGHMAWVSFFFPWSSYFRMASVFTRNHNLTFSIKEKYKIDFPLKIFRVLDE
jgi:hypothetical protein